MELVAHSIHIWLAYRIPGLKGCMQLVQLELKS